MAALPAELGILACLALFAGLLWIPYIVGISKMEPLQNAPDPFERPYDLRMLPAWVHRAYRAHLNLLEQLLPFAILVLIVDRLNGFTALTYWAAIAFFWIRVIHAFGMIAGFLKMPFRPIVYNLGVLCILIMGYAVFTAA
ncbi:MAPEG family protein [Loktanella sp. D2R18]|uniref:MAPEG family protein n=1 Tax=Rhodobacterales TaxID=204455 RepID=UPI000DEADDDC|nr:MULTISPECIES: MAPEG family protein [Rhodobacterales]MDO6591675.1 MAPEG family protein [Yoonia sp. 1_MG-2023]RBW42507.1 MAPEG family protein [Loktanella sp. D2R18]